MQHSHTTPPTAWQRYRSHRAALVASAVLLLMVLVAVVGYPLMPDDSPGANRQLLELARRPPATTAWVLAQPLNDVEEVSTIQYWLGGQPVQYKYTVLDASWGQGGVSFQRDSVVYKLHSGQRVALHHRQWHSEWHQPLTLPLGSDGFGRCTLSRLILGSRISLGVGALAVLLSLGLGVVLGLLAGYHGGWVDGVAQWVMAVMWALPALLLAIAIAFAMGRGFASLCLAVGLTIWVEVARVVRAEVLSLRERSYITAAHVLGLPTRSILFRHILPNLYGPIIILSCANFATAILLEAGLSFLGLGVRPPTPSWGSMVNEGYPFLVLADGKWLAIVPGLALMLLIIALNLVGQGLRDAYDPKAAN